MRRSLLTIAALLATATPAFSQNGDAAAVMQYCGTPTAEHQGTSQVTNHMERDLTYGDVILHFEPSENGWVFSSGWYDHLPMTQSMVEDRMSCFKQAMAASRAQQPGGAVAFEDPAIRAQTPAPASDQSTFGIPHLWAIGLLAILVIAVFAWPGARRRSVVKTTVLEQPRYQRRPVLDRFRRRGSNTRLDV